MNRNLVKKIEQFGEHLSDSVTAFVGSWRFIILQSFGLLVWIIVNTISWVSWDPYPYILCNLALSFAAAYTAPFIMMSQNRQAAIDRAMLIKDLHADMAELEQIKNISEQLRAIQQHLGILSE